MNPILNGMKDCITPFRPNLKIRIIYYANDFNPKQKPIGCIEVHNE